jgi:hypothetical protein
MKKITYQCVKCGREFSTEKECNAHEELCKNYCELRMDIYLYGGKIRFSWITDKSIFVDKNIAKNVYKVGKNGLFNYHCYTKADDEHIAKAKNILLNYALKEMETLKKSIEEQQEKLNTKKED